ncbi:MAG: hypothetical protein HFE39_06955 [Clostridiales bacterium]|jgi:hypothetical protein|nr:hypothetical protein [Clostridiales bacterium]
MKIKIRTTGFRLFLPIPLFMIGFAIRMIPNQVFEEMRRNTPDPYRTLITKENFRLVAGGCLEILKQNKGLEIVNVQASDGTFVSVQL